MTTNGRVSYWYSEIGMPSYRDSLPGDRDADVAIVGGGLTGLWTAYYLAQARPDLAIVVLEREFAGYGASGRNGGWLSAQLAVSRKRYAAQHGHDQVVALLREMQGAVDEVAGVLVAEGIDADLVKDGMLRVARNPAQRRRLEDEVAHEHADWGAAEEDIRLLEPAEAADRIRVQGVLRAAYTPHCARVQPAKLVRGLAEAVERRGVTIYERTPVRSIERGAVQTHHGTVRAAIVLRCLEGFTAELPGARRSWLPMNSSMIVTEPLAPDVHEQIGWRGAELLGDEAHAYMYAQRTADMRIAIGGRGVPYRFGSRTDDRGVTQQQTVESLTALLYEMFPAVAGTPIAHAWCGVLGVPRDWSVTVDFDPAAGFGTAGGYVGSGLTTTNLAGRTLADLVAGVDSPRTRLPWVGHRVRQWEPEPLRYLGVHAMYRLYRAADRREHSSAGDQTSRLARFGDWVTGR